MPGLGWNVRIRIREPSGESERDCEGGVRIGENVSVRIVIECLHYISGGIDNDPQRPDLIVAEIVIGAIFGHGERQPSIRILKEPPEVIVSIMDGQKGRPAFPEIFLYHGSVNLLGNSSAKRIGYVVRLTIDNTKRTNGPTRGT